MTDIIPYFVAFCRFSIGIAFAVSFAAKFQNFSKFEQTVFNFRVFPKPLSKASACIFLITELTIVVLVTVGGVWLMIGFTVASILLVLFTVALTSVLLRKMRIPCNCFGSTETVVSSYDLWRNSGFLLCAIGGIACQSLTNNQDFNLPLVGVGLMGLASAIFVTIWLHLRDIAQLFKT